jgi:hypothetical protein
LGVDMQTNGFNVSFPDCIWMVDRDDLADRDMLQIIS